MDGYQDKIREIAGRYEIPEEGTEPGKVLELCLGEMNSLCQDPPEDWLRYTFAFLQASFFPENFKVQNTEERREGVSFYLDVLNCLLKREREQIPYDARRDFCLMQPDERPFCGIPEEYGRFEHCFYEGNVCAFLRLSKVCTPYNTSGHVAGVHHVAMFMARQLQGSEVKVDPGLMSAAAVTHDMGKFGCRPMEAKRVPYLHYYYTYQFCRRFDLPMIGSIAANHSVWDLELDNLSCESLLLIYADFRVKSVYDADHKEHIHFWTLKEAFDVILSKLDNVDEKKCLRYERVYAKLRDFEDYLISLGCSVDLDEEDGHPLWKERKAGKAKDERFAALMDPEDVTDRFRMLAIRFNLSVMHDANYERRFATLLERVRSERNWRNVRAFLTVIGEYCVYFPQELKRRLLTFLAEMMSHPEGDIRRQAAAIAGMMIADFELKFTKEIPSGYDVPKIGASVGQVWDEFLTGILSPGLYMQDRQIRWSGYALKTVLESLLSAVSGLSRQEMIHIFSGKCREEPGPDVITFILIDCASQIPFADTDPEDVRTLSEFACDLARKKSGEIRAAAMIFILGWLRQGFRPDRSYAHITGQSEEEIAAGNYCLRYLDARINEFFGIPSMRGIGVYELTSLYLENQRSEVPWIYKYMNLEILHRLFAGRTDENDRFQYASHLVHLLQFGGRIVNRLQAGEHLIDVMEHMQEAQRYELILELARALEINEYSVAKYIPRFLGRLMFFLPVREQKEMLERMRELITGGSTKTAVAALETAGIYLQYFPGLHMPAGMDLAGEALGLLCMGLSHYETGISRESLYIAGQRLFGNADIPDEWRERFFTFLARKILTLTDWKGDSLTHYFQAAALHYIYAFISDFEHRNRKNPLREEMRPYAFFPGTFDPFSLGHAKIVQQISQMGYRVYLAADEFSWSKRTQPFEIRRKIIEMSTAWMSDVFLFPEEIPVNIAFPEDIRRMVDAMGGKRPTIVAGSDVIRNASAYRKDPGPDSVLYLPHIIFARNDSVMDEEEIAKRLPVRPQFIHLPPHFETISSSRIRDNINEGREISTLVSRLADHYIHAFGLYAMEPAYKKAARYVQVETMIGNGAVCITDEEQGGRICGEVRYHEIDQGDLYGECQDVEKASLLRKLVSGKIAVITHIEGECTDLDDKRLTVVNEALEWFQENRFSYALCFDLHKYSGILKPHGFVPVKDVPDAGIVDLRNPVVLFYDTPSAVKDPLAGEAKVRLAVRRAHLRLLEAMTAMYPGQLILCFESGVMNYRLVKLITEENTADGTGTGEKMCVPFGKILKGNVVPRTVTKGLDTEKVYDEDLESFSISEFPGYAPLDLQIRAIRSFHRPVMLVDDLYHNGYRAGKILDSCMAEGIGDVQLITGVLSGRGKDQAQDQGIRIRSVYSVPNLRTWFIESDLYPFLGGDSVRQTQEGYEHEGGERIFTGPIRSLPSINTILPYEIPGFLKDVSVDAVYRLSRVCLENAREIMLAIEEAYSSRYGRRLVTERLSEVIAQPRHPDSISFDGNMLQELTSSIIAQQEKRLRRLKYPENRQ